MGLQEVLPQKQQPCCKRCSLFFVQNGELVRTGNALLKAEITSADGSRAAEPEVTDNKNGTYEVGYTLRSEGEHSFALLLYGQPVRGSPFRLRAVKPSDVPQSPDDVKRRVKSPSGTGGHIRQKAVRRPSSMYSTTKKKENPIEDELIYRVGKTRQMQHHFMSVDCRIESQLARVPTEDETLHTKPCCQEVRNETTSKYGRFEKDILVIAYLQYYIFLKF